MPQELVLTASSALDSSILIHDLHSSNHIQTFRQSSTASTALTITPARTQFLAAQVEKGVVHVYTWGNDTISMKMILPEKMRSLGLSPTGTWCVGGSESGKLFVWEVRPSEYSSFQSATGDLLFAREAHYQALSHICFTADELMLFTGGDDAVVHSWPILHLVDPLLQSEHVMPVRSWNDHTLSITGIQCRNGTALNSRAYTSSLDQTVKVSEYCLAVDQDMGSGFIIFADHNSVSEPYH
jgi:pre-rRNA-processing protein IPI3